MQGTIWNMGPANQSMPELEERRSEEQELEKGLLRSWEREKKRPSFSESSSCVDSDRCSETAMSQTSRASGLKVEVDEESPPLPPVEPMKHTGSHQRVLLLWSTRVPTKKV